MAAAAALTGHLVDVREVMVEGQGRRPAPPDPPANEGGRG